jgi:guanylate kinase
VAARGLLVVLSAPSGAGKASVLRRLRERGLDLAHPVSVTTRSPREDEVDGREYFFRSRQQFDAMLEDGAFVEWAEVHGARYGTLRSELERCTETGTDCVLELDVQGMRNLRRAGVQVVSIFLMPPSMEELEQRLRGRGQNDEASIALRLENALEEMEARGEYDHVIVNDDLDAAAEAFEQVLKEERARRSREIR